MNKLALILAAASAFATASVAAGDKKHVQVNQIPDAVAWKMEMWTTKWLPERLPELYGADVRIRFVAMPTFSPLYGIAVKQSGGIYRVSYATRPFPMGGAWFPPPLERESCEAPVDAALAERLIGVWKHMMQDVFPYEAYDFGLDGATYFFAYRENDREAGALKWSPEDGTPDGMLVDIARDMAAYCSTARYWFAAPATWYKAKVLNRKLDTLDAMIAKRGKQE
jgi:hypothetical protein